MLLLALASAGYMTIFKTALTYGMANLLKSSNLMATSKTAAGTLLFNQLKSANSKMSYSTNLKTAISQRRPLLGKALSTRV